MILTAKSTHGVIRFSLKESIKSLEATPKKQSLIMLHFTSKGKRFKKSIGFKCSLHQWDVLKQRIKTGKGMMANAYKLNTFINDLQTYTEDELSAMVKDIGYIDIEKMSYLIQSKIRGNGEEKEILNLIRYAENLAEEKKNHVSKATYNTYQQTISQLKNYEKQKEKQVLKFENIDMSFYRKFKKFLEDEDFSLNTIGKHFKTLKTFLNEAFINGLTTNTIFKNRNFKVAQELTTDIYLTNEEIKTLEEENLKDFPVMELARDIFLMGCYTGQRVSDYNGITDENIEEIDSHKFIKVRQKKTDTIVHIPITKEIQKVMNRYNNNFPPKQSEPVLRKNIKAVCSKVGFNELINVSYTKGGKLIKIEVPKYQLVKTHTARRSFCTNHYVAGKSIQSIMLFSGHKTERNFYRYIRIEKEQKALAVLKSGFFE